ncbi:MAG: hypothetical protein ABDH31_05365 [Chlorobiota bacterium]
MQAQPLEEPLTAIESVLQKATLFDAGDILRQAVIRRQALPYCR